MTTPKLRFKEFDENWTLNKIGDIASKVGSGSTPRGGAEAYTSKGIIFIRSQNVNNDRLLLNDVAYIPDETHNKMSGSKVIANDILLNITGASIGRSCVVPSEFKEGNVNQHVCIIRTPNDDPLFIQSFLSSDNGQNAIESKQVGSGREGLNFQAIRSIDLFLPQKKEQTKIATFLSAVDEKISQLTQKHELLSQYKQGMMQKLFSQQIRFKADDGSEFGEWEEKELKEVAEINPKAKKLPANFIYIDLESVEKGQLLLQKNIELQDAPSRAQRLLAKGDVLFQMVRPYQQNNYYFNLSGEYVASTGYAQIRTKLDSKFIYYALHEKTFLDEVMNRCTGTSYPAINSSDLSSIEMFVPCLEEQTKIANFLSAIDQKIEVVAQQIQHAKLWKKGLLQQMFV